MDAYAAKTAIKDELEDVLPALLATAGLADFEDYLAETSDDKEKRQLCVYLSEEADTTDRHTMTFLIMAQLHGEPDHEQKYHGVLMAAIREHITADIVGMVDRDSITADSWPPNRTGASFDFYTVTFSEPLDDGDR